MNEVADAGWSLGAFLLALQHALVGRHGATSTVRVSGVGTGGWEGKTVQNRSAMSQYPGTSTGMQCSATPGGLDSATPPPASSHSTWCKGLGEDTSPVLKKARVSHQYETAVLFFFNTCTLCSELLWLVHMHSTPISQKDKILINPYNLPDTNSDHDVLSSTHPPFPFSHLTNANKTSVLKFTVT